MPQLPRVIDRRTALHYGLSAKYIRHRLASGRWVRMLPGIYFTRGPEPTYRDRLAAALVLAGPHSALSGAAALVLWGFDVPRPQRPLVLVPYASGGRAIAAVQIRRTPIPFSRREFGELRAVEPARAIADHCVGLRSLAAVQSVASEALRRRVCTADQLAAAYAAGPRRGSAHLRVAVEDVSFDAWSLPEARIGRALRAARVPQFAQNVAVRASSGRFLGVADVWWEELRAALEVQGARDHSSSAAWNETVRRASRFEADGISVMHVPAVDILRDLDVVVARVTSWLRRLAERSPATG